jgi:hypothetical protein
VNYYYLGASLPMFSLGMEPPISWAKFMDLCREQLQPPDMAALEDIVQTGGERTQDAFGVAWHGQETRLRNAIARHRASRLGRDPESYLRPAGGTDLPAEAAVANAFSRSTPLERELEIDRFRWKRLEEIAGLNPFAAAAIFAYALKLRLAERWTRMDADKGASAVDDVIRGGAAAAGKPKP